DVLVTAAAAFSRPAVRPCRPPPRPRGAPLSPAMTRRTFLTSTASAAGAIALGCRHAGPDSPSITSSLVALPDPASTGIEHVVVFMMENRSFDHLLGSLPRADGR